MIKRNLALLLVSILVVIIISGYVIASNLNLENTPSPSISPTNTASSSPNTTASSSVSPSSSPSVSPSSSPSVSPSSSPSVSPSSSPSPDGNTGVTEENKEDHEEPADYIWSASNIINIVLNENSITITPARNAVVYGSTVTITSAGTYRISGSLTDGQVIVDTPDKETVQLILSNVDISCSTSAPINVVDAKKVVIILEENTKNYLVDGTSYVFSNIADDEPNAAIFSKADLTICGSGSLSVDANYNDAIASKDGLIIACGIITVDSVDDGIRGKDYIIIKDGVISLNVGGDGLKSDNSQDATAGYISITSGTINITSAGDAMDAETDVMISGGTFTLTTGGGSNSIVAAGTSAKGIKGSVCVIIDAGSFTINSADDAVHSNGIITINEGSFTISTGDDAFHADSKITVNGGDINIIKSFEGIESMVVTINDGRIHLISSDDGINIAGGNDSSGMFQAPGMGGGFDQWGGMFPGIISSSTDHYLYINGGYVVIDALGDGIDSNGAIQMTNGYLIINGPVSNMNGALDYQATSSISGGFLIAVGSSGMAQTLPSSTTQNSILKNFRSIIPADTLINIQSSDGTVICSFTSIRKFQSIALSSAGLTSGVTYNVYINGSTTGTAKDGLYLDGTYTPGTLLGTFTVK